jgi:prevent-host-death family protein
VAFQDYLELNMSSVINTKQLRASLPEIVRRTQRGERFVVLYRSRPAFRVVPIEESEEFDPGDAEQDSLFGAEALGRSSDGLTAKDYDRLLYKGVEKPRSR